MTIFIVVVVFAVVQSLFGVGLLVFGTPTLLLLGYPFAETLAVLLPASLAVSCLQIWRGPRIDRAFLRSFALWCLIPLAGALALVLTLDLRAGLNLLVALALAAFVILRAVPTLGETARRWVRRHERPWLLLMGTVHGLSNLGGGLLTILAASRHRDKEAVRALVALCYSCFAALQLCVLAVLSPDVFGWLQFAYAGAAAAVFVGVGEHIFQWVSAPIFDWLFTALMACYAILLGLRVVGAF